MSANPDPPAPRPLIDPEQLEQAGRAVRLWLEKLRRPRDEPDTSIAWEDGEPAEHHDQPPRG